jgi:hypothetical protein
MPTIVAYTDTQSPRNQYPYRIVSPSHAGPCCASHTEAIGPPERGDRWMYRYKRCRACGFTVRAILHEIPDAALVTSLRETLQHSFMRNVPE